jgi:peptidyl-prolyl cis-trans isomerase C
MRDKTRMIKLGTCALLLLVAGCGEDKASKPSQVLVRVNGQEITVLQLNYLLAQNANQPEGQQRSEQQLLEDLIQQELLVQKADDLKLDRNPNVLQALEFTKRQVLAQAAYGQLSGSDKPMAESEIRTYYNAHPQLFAERQIYDLTVFVVPFQVINASIQTGLNQSTGDAQTSQLLDQAKVSYTRTSSQVAADVLPEQVVAPLHQMKLGDIVQVREGDNMVLMQLKARQDAPLALENARETIVALMNRNKLQHGDTLVALREKAKVEYVQPMGDMAAPAAGTTPPATKTQVDDHLKTGLKGL